MTAHRAYAGSLALGLLAGGLVTLAATRPWAAGTAQPPGLPASPVSVGGSAVAALAAALGPVILAGMLAVVATRGPARRLCGALVAVAGVAVAVQALTAGPALAAAADDQIAGAAGSLAPTPWRWVCLSGALLAVTSGGLTAWRAERWPALGTRYDAPAAPSAADEPADLWRALDRGEDPTR